MPYRFEFETTEAAGPRRPAFGCELQCGQCKGTTRAGARCARTSCVSTPYCWTHLLKERRLRVAPSGLPGAGRGLFAADRGAAPDAVLFRKGDVIIEYGGEPLTRQQLDARYGDFTAPYGLHVHGALYEDGACVRGPGTLTNHAPTRRANAKYAFSRSLGRGVVVATKPVRNGSEVLVNYGNDYRFDEPTQHATRRAARRAATKQAP